MKDNLKLMFIVGIGIVFLIYIFFGDVKIIYVYDSITKEPIVDAKVTAIYCENNTFIHWGCGTAIKNFQTKANGGVVTKIHSNEYSNGQSTLVVEKEGYIENGINGRLSIINRIYLKKIKKYNYLPYSFNEIKERDGLDILGRRGVVKPGVSGLLEKIDPDILIESINVSKDIAKIRFMGQGGVQRIEDNTDLTHGTNKPFVLMNMTTPPAGLYDKEMVIESSKQYVALLRDGETYVKFIPIIKDCFYREDGNCVSFYIYRFPD